MPRDADFDAFAYAFPAAVLALAGIRSRGHRASSIAAKAQSRALDLVFRSRVRGAPFVYLEVQDRGDVEVERSALLKLAIVCDRENLWRSARAVIVYATDASRRTARSADVGYEGERTLTFTPRRIVLSRIEPESLLARGGPFLGLLPLVGRGDVSARAPSWFAQLLNDPSLSPSRREVLKDFFDRFLRRRTRGRLNVEAPVFLEKMKGVQELVARGEARGEARGQARGRRDQRVASVLAVLEARFARVPRSVRNAVTSATDRQLDAALLAAATVETPAEVERVLAPRARRSGSRRSKP